jgi:plasmid stabilization system protein ParE
MIEHLGEDAELYPLGVLDDDAARNVERHVALCSACAERVAQAQAVAASLAAALPLASPSPALGRRLRESVRSQRRAIKGRPNLLRFAVAAGLALAFLGLGWQTLLLRGQLAHEDVALVTMVHSHFNHVSMKPESPNPVAAKILYARDGSWIYIIADKPGGSLRALGRTAAAVADLGTLNSTGQTATLLVHPRDRIRSITLQRAGATVAAAALVY